MYWNILLPDETHSSLEDFKIVSNELSLKRNLFELEECFK